MIPKHYTIEPKPKGEFRSSLEAQWADAWDQRGVWHLYEPCTFDISPWGGEYTPDFLLTLPDIGGRVWIEIKPAGIELANEWCCKAYGLQRALENMDRRESVIFIQGPPIEKWDWTGECNPRGVWGIAAAGEQIHDALGVSLAEWKPDEIYDPTIRRAQLAEEFTVA